jgi:hypothetical protein
MFGQKLFPSATDLSDFLDRSKSKDANVVIRRNNSSVTLPVIGDVSKQDISKYAVQAAVALSAIGTVLVIGRNYLLSLNNQQFPS